MSRNNAESEVLPTIEVRNAQGTCDSCLMYLEYDGIDDEEVKALLKASRSGRLYCVTGTPGTIYGRVHAGPVGGPHRPTFAVISAT